MSPLPWVAAATLTVAIAVCVVAVAGRRRHMRTRGELTREQKLAAARKAADGLRRGARRAGPGLSDTESARPGFNWSDYSGGPPSDTGGGSGWA